MRGRRLVSLSSSFLIRWSSDPVAPGPLHQLHHLSFFSTSSEQVGKSSLRRRVIPIVLLSLTGGFALSAINDIAIFHGCSREAIEKAIENQNIVEVLGTPIVRGPWYDASLAVGRRRNWVSCTFPISGPHGSGIFRLKAVRRGEDKWLSFMVHNDWDLVSMDVLLHTPPSSSSSSDAIQSENVVRISLTDSNRDTPSN